MSNIGPRNLMSIDLDLIDKELPLRSAFLFPKDRVYLCGHSLGLQPKATGSAIDRELDRWASMAVEAHFRGDPSWLDYLDDIHMMMSNLCKTTVHDILVANTLTTNIHQLLSGFYRPVGRKTKVIVDFPTFSSDIYAIRSHLAVRNIAPEKNMLYWNSDATGVFHEEDLELLIERHKEELALAFFSGVNYLNGQFLDVPAIVKLCHKHDILVGFDLAHAVGSVPIDLNGWDVDFACWCTYKYLCGGPGGLGVIYINPRHHQRTTFFKGWWGNDMSSRFKMLPEFTPAKGVAQWALSNPSILALAPLRVSLSLFDKVGMDKIVTKSRELSGYLIEAILDMDHPDLEIVTPVEMKRRGAMLCLRIARNGEDVFQQVSERVIIDFRQPNIIRVAPHGLFNSYRDCYVFLKALAEALPNVDDES